GSRKAPYAENRVFSFLAAPVDRGKVVVDRQHPRRHSAPFAVSCLYALDCIAGVSGACSVASSAIGHIMCSPPSPVGVWPVTSSPGNIGWPHLGQSSCSIKPPFGFCSVWFSCFMTTF